MIKEIVEICKELKKWCEKYDKNYYNIAFIDGNISASINVEDKDYDELSFIIYKENGIPYKQSDLFNDYIKKINETLDYLEKIE